MENEEYIDQIPPGLLNKFWFQCLMGGIWALILMSLGFFDIEPLVLRFLLLPILGLPIAVFVAWRKDYEEFYKYLAAILLGAPIIAFWIGALMGAAIHIIGIFLNFNFKPF